MRSVRYGGIIILFLLHCLLSACGGGSEPEPVVLSGTIEGQALSAHPDKPVLVAVIKNNPTMPMGTYSLDDIIAMVSADKSNRSFRLDLTESGLKAGDEINIVAFVDVNHSNNLPNPDAGDTVGIYIDTQTYSPVYVIKSGENNGFHIRLNRLIRPFTTEIGGTVRGDAAGELLIVVYAGAIDALDFTHLDPDKVVGYARKSKGASELRYSLELLPYPEDVQTDSVFIVALLDDRGAGMPAPGNLVGFHTDPTGATPQFFPLAAGRDTYLTSMDIQMRFPDGSGEPTAEIRIPEPSGDTVRLRGRFTPPDDFNPDEGAVFALVAQTDNPSDIFASPLTSVKYFYKLAPGVLDFSMDLSDTGLSLEDEVMVIGLWDRDFQSGFPNPTAGDVTGYLQNKDEMSYSIVLSQWQDRAALPEGWDFSINKTFYDREASVQFNVYTGDGMIAPSPGDVLIAVAVEEDGIDIMHGALDMDSVVGLGRFVVGRDAPPYTMNIMPVIHENIEVGETPFLTNITIVALLDNNPANGRPDRDEYIGMYSSTTAFGLSTFDVQDGNQVLGGNVIFFPDMMY